MQSNADQAVKPTAVQKRSRARGPNSKAGCLTCKRRHVKCDETKDGPTGGCSRCATLGYKCEWKFPNSTSSHTRPRRLLCVDVRRQFQANFYKPSANLFREHQEYQYYQLFCTNIAPNLSGNAETDLWNRLILQACDTHESIRYMTIAIAALKCTSEAAHFPYEWVTTGSVNAVTHHQFALQAYSKAIRSMRDAAVAEKQDTRTTLISCIVLTCFQAYHGDHEAAVKQITIGIKILQDHLLNQSMIQQRDSPLESELIQAFGSLEIQSMALIDTQSMNSHRQQKDFGLANIEAMPAAFESVIDAEFYFGIIVQRLLHWGASVVMPDCGGCLKMDTALCIPVEQVPVRETHLRDMRRWHDAFAPFLRDARNSTSSSIYLSACSAQLIYLTSYFSAAVIKDSSQKYPDTQKFMPIFRQIVALARSVVQHPQWNQGKSMFAFGMQVVAPLYNVARRCPHRGLRREAISLLFKYPRREGLWDGILVGKIAEWVVHLEEDELDKELEYVPDNMRCCGVDFLEYDLIKRRAFVKGMVPNSSGKLVRHEKILRW